MGKLLPLLQSKWLAAALGGVLFLGLTAGLALRAAKSLAPAPVAHEQTEPSEPPPTGAPAASWGFTNPEIEELVRDLREEKPRSPNAASRCSNSRSASAPSATNSPP